MIFMNLQKAKVETDIRRQNSRTDFHPLPNTEILDPRGFEGQDPHEPGCETLPWFRDRNLGPEYEVWVGATSGKRPVGRDLVARRPLGSLACNN